ncbi:unnamed protein product [Medioppia subpectinata]|uniref:Uncharacterized protein n=1 Tax=Medioppia subpectinata TaxID=1979941 RepID=A0A7R9Q0X8_9ACAR|nr:unnamed protein product [Medioppia subpectinata]CAG2107757.1 unnamed protein product [Medioppia subpectinata]
MNGLAMDLSKSRVGLCLPWIEVKDNMFKHIIIVALIAFNSMHMFDANRRLDESLVRQYMSMDATIYADIRSRLNGKDSRPQNNSTDQIEDNVRELRQFFSGGVLQAPTYQCQYMVSYFGLILFEFIKCILINEIPGNICLGCAQQYTDLIQAYADLTNETVSNCTLGFINKDKANLIHSLYSNGIYQWKDGDCDNCFGGKDQYENLVVHNDTQYYFQLTEEHMNCLQSANSSHNESCIECKTSYHVINDYYDLLAENYTNDVCNDIIASVYLIIQ